MCIGERIHIVARFGGKVFGQVQGDAAPLLSLSLSRLLFLFLPFVHSLILLSCAYSPLTILLFLRPSSPTNRLFCQFLAPPSLSLSLCPVSFPLHSSVPCIKHTRCTCTCVESTPPPPPRLLAGLLAYQGCSFRLVSFRFVFRLRG